MLITVDGRTSSRIEGMYPRAGEWVTPQTTAADRALLGLATRVHVIEYRWLSRLRNAQLYGYRLAVRRLRGGIPCARVDATCTPARVGRAGRRSPHCASPGRDRGAPRCRSVALRRRVDADLAGLQRDPDGQRSAAGVSCATSPGPPRPPEMRPE